MVQSLTRGSEGPHGSLSQIGVLSQLRLVYPKYVPLTTQTGTSSTIDAT